MKLTPANTGRKQDGTFAQGQSGNPKGKPKGAKNRTTQAVAALLEGEAEALTRKAIEKALKGDMVALKLCLDRVCPTPKDRAVSFKIPPIKSACDTTEALRSVLSSISNGDITPSEGQVLAGILEVYRKAIETQELEERITELEKAK